MHWVDLSIFVIYMLAMLGVGLFFFQKNRDSGDYCMGGPSIPGWHVGLFVSKTDVEGGISPGSGWLGLTLGTGRIWMRFSAADCRMTRRFTRNYQFSLYHGNAT